MSLVLVLAVVMSCAPAPSQGNYPTRPITLIVPATPGEDADLVMRIVAGALTKELAQTVMVENVGGGNGADGTDRARKSAPDGYTLVSISENTIINQRTGLVSYGPLDFVPIASLATSPVLLVTAANRPWSSTSELIADAKNRPNAIKWGMLSSSTNAAFAFSLMAKTGATFEPVSYEVPSALTQALLSGQVDVAATSTTQQILGSRDLKFIGWASEKRAERFPQIPTFREQGLDLVFGMNHGLAAPKGTPTDIIKKLEGALQKAMASADARTRLETDQGVVITFLTSDKYQDALSAKDSELDGILKQSGRRICPIWPFCR